MKDVSNKASVKAVRRDASLRKTSTAIIKIALQISLPVLVPIIYSFTVQCAGAFPSIADPELMVDKFVTGLTRPTSMAFIDSNNILILEKGGRVMLASNGELRPRPVLEVSVNDTMERGLLGIAIVNNTEAGSGNSSAISVFLYYTESHHAQELRNRVYKYDWNGKALERPKLILDLPALPGPEHNGGKVIIGPDGFLYAIIGDLNPPVYQDGFWNFQIRLMGKLQNYQQGPDPDDRGVIFRVNASDGSPAPDNPLSNDPHNPLSRYYAYGIRNGFGIAFDPVTGNLWDTENGPEAHDEINLVTPGFNSGWQKVTGPIPTIPNAFTPLLPNGVGEAELVNYNNSHYSDPVVDFWNTIGITDLEFLESSQLGPSYANNTFVGDFHQGNLYYFKVNADRSGFDLKDPRLTERGVIAEKEERSLVTFGTGFGPITDIETGPDGLLYILSYGTHPVGPNEGTIYRIGPSRLM